MRTTIYLAGPAAEALERVRTEYAKFGVAVTTSAVLARLLLGETIDEVIQRPCRPDLTRIAGERDRLRNELKRAKARHRVVDVHRIHREVADLYPAVKRIANTLGRARRRSEPYTADLAEATRIEQSLDELMVACAEAIVPSRRR